MEDASSTLTAWDPTGVAAVEAAVDAALLAGSDPRNSTVSASIASAYFALSPSLSNFNAVIAAAETSFGSAFDATAVANGRGLALQELGNSGDPTNAQASIAALFPAPQVRFLPML